MTTKNSLWLCARLLVLVGLGLLARKAFAADPPPPPIVHILATDPCASETGGDTATFTAVREGPTNGALTVAYRLGGTASNGVDYVMLPGHVTFAPGARRAPITVTPIDDFIDEGTETIFVELVQPLVWPPPYIVCWPSFAFGHIEDNDTMTNRPPVVRLVNPPDGSVFVGPIDLRLVAAAHDPDGRVRTVEFFDGTNSLGLVTNRPSIVRPELALMLEDEADEIDPASFPDLADGPNLDPALIRPDLFRLLWEDVPPGEHVLTAVATDNLGASTHSGPVHIRVTPPPPQPVVTVKATDPSASEGPRWSITADALSPDRIDTATFTVHRSGRTDLPLTVFYRLGGTALNGVDYRELPHSVTILPGARAANVVVEPIDDALVEGPEKVVLQIVPPICIAIFPPPYDCYLVGREDEAVAVIQDNDLAPSNRPPVVEIVRPEDGDVFLAPVNLTLVAAARDYDGRVVSVEFFDGTNSLGVVSNNANALSPARPPFSLVWSNVPPGGHVLVAKATDDDGAMSRSRPVEIKVVERSEPPVVSIEATDPDASEGSNVITPGGPSNVVNTATFTVKRTGNTARSLLVYYSLSGSASNGVDYELLPGRVLIPDGAASANIVVKPIDDRLFEGTELVVAALEPSRCLAPANTSPVDCYVVGTNSRAQANIRDNDIAPNTNQPPKIGIVRPEDGSVFVAPAEIRIVAEARDPDGYVRTVEFFANGSSLGVVSNSLSTVGAPEQFFPFAWSGVPAGAYTLTAKATDNRGAMTTSEPVRIRVIEVNPQPVVTVEAADPWAAEGELTPTPVDVGDGHVAFIGPPIALLPDNAVFVVKRDRGTNIDLIVHYRLDGTARNGVDYRMLSGQVTIPRGAYAARIVVDPIDDLLVEGTETVIATLEPIACPAIFPPPPGCYLVGDPARALAYIRDNDFENQLPKVEIAFPADGSTFVAPADIDIGVYARDPDGWVERVEFFAGTNKIGEDAIYFIQPPPPGQLQRFSITWSNVPPGAYVLTAKATDNRGGMSRSDPVEIKVTEPCRIPVVTLAVRDAIASEPFADPRALSPVPDTATFVVRRTCRTNESLTVFYSIGGSASNGVDYAFLRGHVTIAAGSETAEIVINPIDDKIFEGTETVKLELEPPVCIAIDPPPPGCYLVGRPAGGVAYIRDNDEAPNFPPRIALLNPPDGSVFPAPADILLVAEAADSDGWVVTVEFFEGTNSLGIVTNHPRVIDPVRPIGLVDVAAVGDSGVVLEPAVAFDAVIRPINPFQLKWEDVPPGHYFLTAKATDNRGAMTRTEPNEIKVFGRPERPIVTISAPDPKAFEGCPDPNADCIDTATFTVKRRGPTNDSLRVYYRIGGTASNGVDYREIPNAVVIAAGERTADIVIEAIDDARVEGTEAVVLTLTESPACALDIFPPSPECYEIGRARVARAAIYDNDVPPNEPPHVQINQPQDGDVFRAPADIRLVAYAQDREDGYNVKVEFFEGTNSLGFGTFVPTLCPAPYCPNFALTWSNVPPGEYVLTAVATDSTGGSSISGPVEIKVVGITPPPVVNIIATDPEAREISPILAIPPDPATFRVTRTGETNRALTVYLRIGGTAENAVDYQFIRAHATIAAGTFSTDITVNVIDDQKCEGDESVIIGLLPSVSVDEFPPPADGYIVGTNRAARAVIHDDDTCPTNVPPPVVMVQPEDGDVFRAPADILLVAKAGDADGRVVLVEFYAGTNKVGMATGPSDDGYYRARWIQVPPGSYVLTAVATDDDHASSRSEPVRIRVIDVPVRPVVCIEAADEVGSESGDEAAFVVKRDCCTNDALVVFYTLSGSASNGVDYEFLRGHVTIPAGSYAARIVVHPFDDNLVEGTESVIAQLSPSPCAVIFPPTPACYLVGRCSRDVVYIRDNDSQPNLPPGVAILFPSEGSVFTAPADIDITAVALDPDGWVTQILFFEGTNQIGGLAILVSEPPPPGELQVFHFNWTDVPPGHYTLTARVTDNRGAETTSGPIHVSVRGDELPVVTVVARDPSASEQDPRLASPVLDTATFVIHRTGGLQLPSLVRYRLGGTARNGVDYEGLTEQVLLPAGVDSAPIVIRPIDDDEVEGTESVVLALEQPDCLNTDPRPASCYRVGEPGRAIAYIRDNDTEHNLLPRVVITSPHAGQVFEAPANIPVMALTRDPDGWVQTVESFEGTNKIGEASVYFIVAPPPGQLQEFTIRWVNVPPGHYRLTAKATDNLGAGGWSAPVDIVVVEPAPIPSVSIVALDALAREGAPANPATFRVRRTGSTNAPLNVFYAITGTASNGVDYSTLSGSVVIPAGRRAARITVTPVDDRRPEPIETVILRVLDAALYNAGHPARAGAIILDNDHPTPLSLRLNDRTFHLRTDGMTGGCYRLEASGNLRDWDSLCVCRPDNGTVQFVDPDADGLGVRFYRMIPDVCEGEDE